ncbi:MAG: cupin domain-containing protein [Deltaproteobacteria bacterium]|jgi:mannose-6-phosphate isomerase-like protein (cupin superfamily)|nr:cupin domain-containing protein [Deltaproteobacteria bacterium]
MKIIHSAELTFVPASHEDPKSPGVFKKILLRADDFVQGKIQMVNSALLPTGRAFTPHYHEDMQEVFIIVRGNAKITVDAEEATLRDGDTVVIPVGSVHKMESIGIEDVEYIVIGISKGTHGKTVVV